MDGFNSFDPEISTHHHGEQIFNVLNLREGKKLAFNDLGDELNDTMCSAFSGSNNWQNLNEQQLKVKSFENKSLLLLAPTSPTLETTLMT